MARNQILQAYSDSLINATGFHATFWLKLEITELQTLRLSTVEFHGDPGVDLRSAGLRKEQVIVATCLKSPVFHQLLDGLGGAALPLCFLFELGLCFTFDLHVVSAGRLVRSLIITPSFGRAMSRGLTHHHTSLSLSPGHGGRSKPPRIKPTRCFIGHKACLLAGRLRPRVTP